MVCSQPAAAPAAPRLVQPDALFATSFSLHTANNLSTTESTIKFLRGVTGNTSLAQKVTPTLMRFSKAAPTRVGLAVAVLGTGALAVYERLAGDDDKAAAKPAEGSGTYVFVGEIDQNGIFRKEVAGNKKP
jgi:hypothetical protein